MGITSNINHILMPKQWWFRTLCTLKDEHLKSYTIKCIIKVCIFHENASHSPGLYCHSKLARELQTETENPGKEIRFSTIVFCYKLNTKNERLCFSYSSGCFLKMQIKYQVLSLTLYFMTQFSTARRDGSLPPPAKLTPIAVSFMQESRWWQGTQGGFSLTERNTTHPSINIPHPE